MHRLMAGQLRKVVEGDRRATAWLYDTFAPQLFRRLRQRYGAPYDLDPEELLHDAFVYFLQDGARVVARFIERYPEGSASELRRYLWDYACGLASNELRKRKTRRVGLQAAPPPPSVNDPEGRRIDRDTIRRLERCLRSRRSRLYVYYKMRFIDGLTPNEISQATGWSRRVTYRVRQQLNEAVARCAEDLEIYAR